MDAKQIDKIVFCEGVGGLGNQLFLIAAALSYAERTKRTCVFRRTWPIRSDIKSTSTPARDTYWHNLFINLPQTTLTGLPGMDQYADWKPGFRAIPDLSDKKIVQLCGHFQSPKYFNLDKLKDLLFPKQLFNYAKTLLPPTSFAFMHFRRGDYKHLQFCHNVLPLSYYEQASGLFSEHVKFLVFAEEEDMTTIQKEIAASPILSKRTIEFIDTKIPDYLQMLMMAQCPEGGIVANSSFSAWAAYLQPTYNTIVAPTKWFTKPEEAKVADLHLPHWKRITN